MKPRVALIYPIAKQALATFFSLWLLGPGMPCLFNVQISSYSRTDLGCLSSWLRYIRPSKFHFGDFQSSLKASASTMSVMSRAVLQLPQQL